MPAFLRPGASGKSAFGISFDADTDQDPTPSVLPFNANERLALNEQRNLLPITRHRFVQMARDRTSQFCRLIVGQ